MIIVIGGETASGKSNLAFKIAREFNGIIINADAFAFYKELNIGTAKPSTEELASVPTFLFNNVSLNESYSIYEYQRDGRKIIDEYKDTNRPIIIVGGSGLYIRALLYNYELRADNEVVVEDNPSISNIELYSRLKDIDEEAAHKIHPNNRKRILRALNVSLSGEETKSKIDEKTTNEPLYPHFVVGLAQNGDELTASITNRTTKMFELGLKEEALALAKIASPHNQALQAIGYKEIINNPDLNDDALIALISIKTRQLAKRQRTFFKNQFKTIWFYNSNDAYLYVKERILKNG